MPSVATRLGEVVYREQGTGPPVVLLHATLHDSHDFDAILPELAKQYRVIAVDWPWHGESRGLFNVSELSAPMLADTLEDIVTALDLPPAFFIGNSVGGFAAARLAATNPTRVLGLVLVNNGGFVEWTFVARLLCRVLGFPFFARLVIPYMVAQYMQPQSVLDEEIKRKTVDRAKTSAGAAVGAAMWRSFPGEGHDLRSRAGEIRVPTLVAWGRKDPTFPKDAGNMVQRYIAGSRLEFFETGHVVFSSKPGEFLTVVEPFFESVLAS